MSDNGKFLRFKADDITCAGCAEDMENILREKEGILDAKVDYSTGIIDVHYDPSKIEGKKVFMEVNKLGFKVKKD